VLFVGSHTGDQVTNEWKVPKPGVPVIQIDIDPAELGRNYPQALGLMGDAKATLRKMIEALDRRQAKVDWAKWAEKTVEDWRKELEPRRHSAAVPIRPERLCRELTAILPADAILVADTGFAGIWTGTMVYLTHPGQTYLRAAGSLGWGFPASLGAKCAAPDRPVVCFTGDGGFWYHLSEMETAVRCGLQTVTVVNNNSSLAQGSRGVKLAYGDRPGKKEELYNFRQVNFARIAADMGCLGIRVERPEEISRALQEALEADIPAVVEVVTGPEYRAPDPWSPT